MTDRADVDSMTRTRVCFSTGWSDQAANASVPPRTGTSTSPGPSTGIGTVTRPIAPTTLSPASADMSDRFSIALWRHCTDQSPLSAVGVGKSNGRHTAAVAMPGSAHPCSRGGGGPGDLASDNQPSDVAKFRFVSTFLLDPVVGVLRLSARRFAAEGPSVRQGPPSSCDEAATRRRPLARADWAKAAVLTPRSPAVDARESVRLGVEQDPAAKVHADSPIPKRARLLRAWRS
jgi:hypothetical protein